MSAMHRSCESSPDPTLAPCPGRSHVRTWRSTSRASTLGAHIAWLAPNPWVSSRGARAARPPVDGVCDVGHQTLTTVEPPVIAG